MKWYKKLVRNERFLNFLAWVAACYIGFVFKTTRWQRIGWENPQQHWRSNKPFITAFWHNRLMMGPFGWASQMPFYMLISGHKDGQLIAKTVGHHGIRTISGSTSRGGLTALKALLKTLKAGECIGVTPDGPRGPRLIATDGIVKL